MLAASPCGRVGEGSTRHGRSARCSCGGLPGTTSHSWGRDTRCPPQCPQLPHQQPTCRSSGTLVCSSGTARHRRSTHPPRTAVQVGEVAGGGWSGGGGPQVAVVAQTNHYRCHHHEQSRHTPHLLTPPPSQLRTRNSRVSRCVSHSSTEASPYQHVRSTKAGGSRRRPRAGGSGRACIAPGRSRPCQGAVEGEGGRVRCAVLLHAVD